MICCLSTHLVRPLLITFESVNSIQLQLAQKQKTSGYEIPPSFKQHNGSVKERLLPSNYYCDWKAAAWAQRLFIMFCLLAASTCSAKRSHITLVLAQLVAGRQEEGAVGTGGREDWWWAVNLRCGHGESMRNGAQIQRSQGFSFLKSRTWSLLGSDWSQKQHIKIKQTEVSLAPKWILSITSTTVTISTNFLYLSLSSFP